MANQFYFYDATNNETLVIENNFANVSIEGTKRAYQLRESGGSHGGFITGNGNYNSKKITVSRQEWVESGDATAWNSMRETFTKWITKAKSTELYLYILNGEGTKTIYTRIYPMSIGDDKYTDLNIQDSRDFQFISPSGIFIRTTQTTAINASSYDTATAFKEFTIANDGIADCYPEITFTPAADCTYLSVKKSNGNGIKVNFSESNSGLDIVLDLDDLSLTLDGDALGLTSRISEGGPFTIDPDDTSLFVKSDQTGTLTVKWFERYV